MTKEIDQYERKAVKADLTKFCHCSKNSFIELCLWHNGEGVDIAIEDNVYAFTWGQLDAINTLKGLL